MKTKNILYSRKQKKRDYNKNVCFKKNGMSKSKKGKIKKDLKKKTEMIRFTTLPLQAALY